MSLLSAISSWLERRVKAQKAKRFQEGWDWAAGEWASRNRKWAHPSFTQIDRDAYAIAMIWQGVDTSATFGDTDAFDHGAAAFARQLKTSVAAEYETPLRNTDHPFFA